MLQTIQHLPGKHKSPIYPKRSCGIGAQGGFTGPRSQNVVVVLPHGKDAMLSLTLQSRLGPDTMISKSRVYYELGAGIKDIASFPSLSVLEARACKSSAQRQEVEARRSRRHAAAMKGRWRASLIDVLKHVEHT